MMVSVLHMQEHQVEKLRQLSWRSYSQRKKKQISMTFQHLRGLKERGLNIFLPLKKGDIFREGEG